MFSTNGQIFFYSLTPSFEKLTSYACVGYLKLDGTLDEYSEIDSIEAFFTMIYSSVMGISQLKLEEEFIMSVGTKHGYIYSYNLLQCFSGDLDLKSVPDYRKNYRANAFRKDEFDGLKYFNSNIPIQEYEMFRYMRK